MKRIVPYLIVLYAIGLTTCSDQLLNTVKSKISLFDSTTITSIVLSTGDLDPSFQPEVTVYSAFVLCKDTPFMIKPTAEHYGAAIHVDGNLTRSDHFSPPIPLRAGENTVSIEVTAEDGKHTSLYTITVYRTIGIPKTGQSVSYRARDDGELQLGIPWPNSRFTTNGDGTITDQFTGLVWLEDADYFSADHRDDQISECNNLEDYGSYPLEDGSAKGDWRMPNRNELRSLFNYGESNCATWLNGFGFDEVLGSTYWSSTGTFVFSMQTLIYGVPLGDGYPHNVVPVRESGVEGLIGLPRTGVTISKYEGDDGDLQKGVSWPDPRFLDNNDGSITDRLTGLVWLQDGDRFGSQYWNGCIDDCNDLCEDGSQLTDGSEIRDWRLPNVNELATLLNAGESSGATWLNEQCPFQNVVPTDYWTSTTNTNDTSQAWLVNLDTGRFSVNGKGGVTRRCLPVRDLKY